MHIIRLLIIAVATFLLAYNSTIFAYKGLTLKVYVDSDLPIKKKLLDLSTEMENRAKIYNTMNQMAYWESEGKKSFYKLLHAEGYYSSKIRTQITHDKTNSVIFYIDPFERYKISHISVKHHRDSNKDIAIPNRDELSIKDGQFAISKEILSAQEEILRRIENNNCLLRLHISHEAIIDNAHKSVELNFLVDAGSQAKIKRVKFNGLKSIKDKHVRKLIKLKNGQCFRSSYVEDARKSLQNTGLFSSATPDIPSATDEDGLATVLFNLVERKHRSVKAGLEYGTDLGLGTILGWEHRNLFGSGQELRANIFANRQQHIAEINYIEPFFKRDDQTLKLGTKFENRETKSFDSKEGSAYALVERKLSNTWSLGGGGRLSRSIIKSNEGKEHFSLVSIPTYITYDNRADIFNPKRGYDVKLEGVPYFELQSNNKHFFKTRLFSSAYFALPKPSQHVVAVRAAVGSILGVESLSDIPHTERFYIGGSNSLRGYGYQLAGGLDKNKKPIGGRSFVEASIELRLAATEYMGVVVFLDSGRSYDTVFPDSRQRLLQGAGIGLRYMTSVGPIRVDIGLPLDRRKSVDKSFHIYFGIGQTF